MGLFGIKKSKDSDKKAAEKDGSADADSESQVSNDEDVVRHGLNELVLQAIHEGARSGEEIMQIASLPPEVFNEATTLLEIKGRIMALGMNNWALA